MTSVFPSPWKGKGSPPCTEVISSGTRRNCRSARVWVRSWSWYKKCGSTSQSQTVEANSGSPRDLRFNQQLVSPRIALRRSAAVYNVRVWAVVSTPIMLGDPHVGAASPTRFLVRGWREPPALPSFRVVRMSGLGTPLDDLCVDGAASTPVRLCLLYTSPSPRD